MERPSPEMEAAVWSTLYHDPRSSPVIVEMLTGKTFETPPAQPTEEQKRLAHDTVEELLFIHYNSLNEAMKEVLGEEIELPEFD